MARCSLWIKPGVKWTSLFWRRDINTAFPFWTIAWCACGLCGLSGLWGSTFEVVGPWLHPRGWDMCKHFARCTLRTTYCMSDVRYWPSGTGEDRE